MRRARPSRALKPLPLLLAAVFLLAACSESEVTIKGTFIGDCIIQTLRILNETGEQVALADIKVTKEGTPGVSCMYSGTFEVSVPKSSAYEAQVVVALPDPVILAPPTITYEELEERQFEWHLLGI